jgi:teichuronic acid biosynthesis glycosyltransferase TuaC
MVPECKADTLAPRVRALIVTNMYPTPDRPSLGSFVRDQVEALRRIPEVDLEVSAFAPGGLEAYVRGVRTLRRRHRHDRFDIVHCHFGLSIIPSLMASARARAVTLHGTDLAHPRSRAMTLAALRTMDLVATVSEELATKVPQAAFGGPRAVLPAGVDTERFRPIPRQQARAALGLDRAGPYLLFAADPRRPEKRHDRAVSVAGDVPVLTLGGVEPAAVPLWVNAANAVIAPSDREGFGLAVLEALACDVPVLSTPVGIAPQALAAVPGTYCGPFDTRTWREAVAPHLADPDPRVAGRERAQQFSTDRMAARVLAAWRSLLEEEAVPGATAANAGQTGR